MRFEHLGKIEDIEKSIQCFQKALKLFPRPHLDWSDSFSNLASALLKRFEQKRNFEDLEESIQHHREALKLRPVHHPNRSSSLNDLAEALST